MLDWCENYVRPPKTAAQRAQMLAYAAAIWEEGGDPHNSPVHTYLWSRLLLVRRIPSTIRLHRSLPHRESGQRRPAMVAKIEHPERSFVGVHATYLAPDGSCKAALQPVRKIFGAFSGGAVRFGQPRPDRWLVTGEGLETTLSVAMALQTPAWAALSVGNLFALQLPSAAQRVLIAADNDRSGDGQRLARLVQCRLIAEGRIARVMTPRTAGADWNDVMMERADA